MVNIKGNEKNELKYFIFDFSIIINIFFCVLILTLNEV